MPAVRRPAPRKFLFSQRAEENVPFAKLEELRKAAHRLCWPDLVHDFRTLLKHFGVRFVSGETFFSFATWVGEAHSERADEILAVLRLLERAQGRSIDTLYALLEKPS